MFRSVDFPGVPISSSPPLWYHNYRLLTITISDSYIANPYPLNRTQASFQSRTSLTLPSLSSAFATGIVTSRCILYCNCSLSTSTMVAALYSTEVRRRLRTPRRARGPVTLPPLHAYLPSMMRAPPASHIWFISNPSSDYLYDSHDPPPHPSPSSRLLPPATHPPTRSPPSSRP